MADNNGIVDGVGDKIVTLDDLDKDQPAKTAEELAAEKEASDKAAASAKTDTASSNKTDAELEADKKAAEEKAAADKAEAEKKAADDKEGAEGDEGETKPDEFWAEVNKLHGIEKLEVEYPDGVDPLSPEGVHIRERAIIALAKESLLADLKNEDPRAYEYKLHRQNGGDDASFFETKSLVLPDYESFKTSVDLQKQVLTTNLLNKGLDEESAKVIVEKAVTDQKLFERSDTAYKQMEKADKDALAVAEKTKATREANELAQLKGMDTLITDIVSNSKTEKILIPDAKKAEFAEYIRQNTFFDGQNFFLMKPMTKENLAEVIQAEYFGFAKGNIRDLVERKAQTETTRKLLLQATKGSKSKPNTGSGAGGGSSNYVPLGDI